jgi:hypothetical protein
VVLRDLVANSSDVPVRRGEGEGVWRCGSRVWSGRAEVFRARLASERYKFLRKGGDVPQSI